MSEPIDWGDSILRDPETGEPTRTLPASVKAYAAGDIKAILRSKRDEIAMLIDMAIPMFDKSKRPNPRELADRILDLLGAGEES